jgi:7-carboxy-7-deazaguanine synthase
MMNYSVIEKFTSIDGEGPSTGELATFIRFLGCDLRCSWCDTAYSWDGEVKAELMTADEIYNFIKESGAYNVTLTGGEPLIQKGIGDLIEFLAKDENLMIRVETHGGVDIAPFKKRFEDHGRRVQFIVDFKLPTSKMMDKMCLDNLKNVTTHDTYKFVIASAEDLNKAIQLIIEMELIDRCQVYFSPVADLIAPKIIVEKMIEEKLNGVKLQLQLHKYIWPKDMRGV